MRPADQEQGYSPELELHPECQSACRCREPTPDEGQTALSGRPADRYEAWMIAARHYQLVLRERLRNPAVDILALTSRTADESGQIAQNRFGDLRVDDLAVLRALRGPRDGDIQQLGPLGIGECGSQARRDRKNDAPVIVLVGDHTRLAGFDEFLEAAACKKALPLDHSPFGIEVAEGERLGTSWPCPKSQSRRRVIRCREELDDDAH